MVTQFVENKQHHIHEYHVIGITVIGNEGSSSFSMSITSPGSQSEYTKFSIQLIAKLSPCHPGFNYKTASQSCVCCSGTDDVLCSVDGTSREVTDLVKLMVNQQYQFVLTVKLLMDITSFQTWETKPVNSHRSGTTCGSCEEDCTLSFDSVEYIRFSECLYDWTNNTNGHIDNDLLGGNSYTSVYHYVLLHCDWLLVCYYVLLDILLGQNLCLTQDNC